MTIGAMKKNMEYENHQHAHCQYSVAQGEE